VSAILILEDEEGFQTLLTEILSHAGYQVTSARSGAEALEIVQRQAFDLLLLDNRLPGITGLEFLKQFREAGYHTPVIIMTAYADAPLVVQAMRLGAVDFLVKPFRIETVLPLIERCLQQDPPR
jgi:two-component system response regulator AtoC